MKTKAWIEAARLRTLPLAVAGLALGNILAAANDYFNWQIALLSICTATFLQILSNYANDYGDFKNGADNEHRIGPARAVQSGQISEQQMRLGIFALVGLSLISGIGLLYSAAEHINWMYLVVLFTAGILSIIAAVKYTATKNPYGYKGWGDLAVFVFFGLLSVLGAYYLQTGTLNFKLLLPASAFGFLSTGVLNLNNMRDIENDQNSGKITIAVRLGLASAKKYHYALIISAIIFYIIFALIMNLDAIQYLFLTPLVLLIKHIYTVAKASTYQEFNPLLKQLALGSAFSTIIYGLSFLS